MAKIKEETKTCPACGETKPRSEFNKGRYQCRPCHYAASKAWIEANRERHREHNRASYQRNKAKRIAAHREWEAKHPDRDREIRAAALARRTPASVAARTALRRARKLQNGSENVDYDGIWTRDHGMCHLCGGEVDRSEVHFDHVIPLARGGPHTMENIRVSHAVCNLRKGARL